MNTEGARSWATGLYLGIYKDYREIGGNQGLGFMSRIWNTAVARLFLRMRVSMFNHQTFFPQFKYLW